MTPEVSQRLEMFVTGLELLPQMGKPVEMPDDERVRRAKRVMRGELTGKMANELEACINCGMCADACHFRVTTKDPKYTPILKVKLLDRVYRREIGPMNWLYRPFIRDISAKDLEDWQELVYDSCTECGRCAMVCPMGIDIPSMIHVMRRALAAAGLIPLEMQLIEQEQGGRGTVFGIGGKNLKAFAENLEKQGIPVPIDKEKADVLLMSTVIDLFAFHDALTGMIRILNHMGIDYTLRTDGFEGANFGMLSGAEPVQKAASERVIQAAIAIGAKEVITPECGHAYPALRWEAPGIYGGRLPFEVTTISEWIGRKVMDGKLKLQKSANGTVVTYHDPCKHDRTSGVHDEPRAALKAMGFEIREMENSGVTNYCCGGGAGVMVLNRAAPLREKVFALKRRQAEDTGAEALVTACGSCRVNLGINALRSRWTTDVVSLSALVAEHLGDGVGALEPIPPGGGAPLEGMEQMMKLMMARLQGGGEPGQQPAARGGNGAGAAGAAGGVAAGGGAAGGGVAGGGGTGSGPGTGGTHG